MINFKNSYKIVVLLLLTMFFSGSAAAIASQPLVDVDSSGPYEIDVGDDVTLRGTVSISDMPDDWQTVIAWDDPDRPIYYSMYFWWDLDENPAGGSYEAGGFMAGTITNDPISVTSNVPSSYFASKTAGTYPATLYVDIEIYGGDELDGPWIEYYPPLMSDSTVVNVLAPTPLVADAGGPYSGEVGIPVTFDGSGSYDTRDMIPAASPFSINQAGHGIISYEWDFDNDGITDATGKTVQHTFNSAGKFPVTLKVKSQDGFEDTDMTGVVISETNIPEFPTVALPIAAILGLAFFFQRRKE